MSTKEVIRCQSCGSSTITNLNNGTGICEHCKSKMILPKEKSEIISLLNSAYVYRETYNYDLAIKTYEYAIEKDPQELSAYEGIILSTYGIEYVKDPHTSKLIPTCHRAHFKNVFENEYYKAFLTIANDDQKAALEVKLNEINKLQAAIERQLQNEQEFDVFISYKSNDENGDKTEDSVLLTKFMMNSQEKIIRFSLQKKLLKTVLVANMNQ
jgi:tetratricopeptide (TPR) repeat protein